MNKKYQKPQIVEKIKTTVQTKSLFAWQFSMVKWMIENKSIPYRFIMTATPDDNK